MEFALLTLLIQSASSYENAPLNVSLCYMKRLEEVNVQSDLWVLHWNTNINIRDGFTTLGKKLKTLEIQCSQVHYNEGHMRCMHLHAFSLGPIVLKALSRVEVLSRIGYGVYQQIEISQRTKLSPSTKMLITFSRLL